MESSMSLLNFMWASLRPWVLLKDRSLLLFLFIIVEVEDSEGNPMIDPIVTRTNIFGQVHDLDLGTFISGDEYKLTITLPDQRFVLPKVILVTINNPTPQTTSKGTTFSSHLNLDLADQFCFGDFEEDGDIDLNDIFALGTLVREDGIPDLQEAINLDGLGGFDLFDALTLLKNFRCEEQVLVN